MYLKPIALVEKYNLAFSYTGYTDRVEHKDYADFVFGSAVGFGSLSGLNPFSHAPKLKSRYVLTSHFLSWYEIV